MRRECAQATAAVLKGDDSVRAASSLQVLDYEISPRPSASGSAFYFRGDDRRGKDGVNNGSG
jgi:hypothetical protein